MTRRWADTDDTDIYEGRNVGPRYNRKHKAKGGGVKEVKEHVISIHDGKAEFVFDDELIPLTREGDTVIRRASHVEPCSTFGIAGGGWAADMRPSGGGLLLDGGVITDFSGDLGKTADIACLRGYQTREQALQAEKDWLRKEKGL